MGIGVHILAKRVRNGVIPHVTQIAAKNVESGLSMNIYIRPDVPISLEAQRVTGIVMTGDKMTVHGNNVEPVTIKQGINMLSSWLNTFSNVLLVAHNGRRFDFPVMIEAILKTDSLKTFNDNVLGFVDSLAVFRKHFPKLKSYKQEYLVQTLMNSSYNVHNAEADVTSLGDLITHTSITNEQILSFSFPPSAVLNSVMFNRQKSLNIRSLDPLVSSGICKRPTAENIAGSGLNLNHLMTIYKRSGEDGFRDVFTAKNCEGFPSVTNCKKVLDEVLPKLCQFFLNKTEIKVGIQSNFVYLVSEIGVFDGMSHNIFYYSVIVNVFLCLYVHYCLYLNFSKK